MGLIPVPARHVEDAWEDVEPFVLQALLKTGSIDDFDPFDIKEMLESGSAQLWVYAEDEPIAIAVTRILVYPKRKVLSIFLTSAEPHTEAKWIDQVKTLALFGQSQGCSGLRIGGRKGWARKFNAESSQTLFTLSIGGNDG